MKEQITKLLILQDKDEKIHLAKTELKNIPLDAAKLKESFTNRAEEVTLAKELHQEAVSEAKKVGLDRKTRQDTILKLKIQQGETRKNEQYQMLTHEIDRYQNDVDTLETKELELLEIVDEKASAKEAAIEALKEYKVIVNEKSKELLAKKANISNKIKEISLSRAEAAQAITPDVLSLYERILAKKGAPAMSPVSEDGHCKGCHMKLPPGTKHQVLAEKELIQCSECSRILYRV